MCYPNCWSESSGDHGVSQMGKCGVSTLFVVAIVVGGFVLCGLVIDDVVVVGGRFLGIGHVGCVGRLSAVAFRCGDVLMK